MVRRAETSIRRMRRPRVGERHKEGDVDVGFGVSIGVNVGEFGAEYMYPNVPGTGYVLTYLPLFT